MKRVLALALAGLASAAAPQRQSPAPEGREAPRATVRLAPYRFGDLLWENDRTAHRIYGHPLEAAEPPSSSGIDAWGKNVRTPFMERQLRGGDQHADHGEGLDFYDVHGSRGAGGLGIWHDNKLWTSRNFVRARILQDGPDVARFAVDYAPWPVDVVRKVRETRRFALPMGSSFTRMVSTIGSDRPGPLTVGIGIAKRAVGGATGVYAADRATGRITWWSAAVAGKGSMGVALMVDPQSIVGLVDDYDNYIVLLRVRPGKPFVYYMGAAWDRGPDIRSPEAWRRYVQAQSPSFDPATS